MADLLNFALVAHILGRKREEMTAYLLRGFNYDMPNAHLKPLFPVWESLAKQVIPRKLAYSGSGGALPDGKAPIAGKVVLAPSPYTSNWWSFENCRARYVQPVVANFRFRTGKELDTKAARTWNADFFSSRHCLAKHNINGSQELRDLDGLILLASRGPTGRRRVRNEAELFNELRKQFSARKIALVTIKTEVMNYPKMNTFITRWLLLKPFSGAFFVENSVATSVCTVEESSDCFWNPR